MGKCPGRSTPNKIINYDEQEITPGKQNARATCSKDRLESGFVQILDPKFQTFSTLFPN